jgi:hypothetical protein
MEDKNKESEAQYYRPSPDNGKRGRGTPPFGQVFLGGFLTGCYFVLAFMFLLVSDYLIANNDASGLVINLVYTIIVGLPIVSVIVLFIKKKPWYALGVILALVLPFLAYLACLFTVR